MQHSVPRIVISLGDPGGIGPEIAARAIEVPRLRRRAEFRLIGDPAGVKRDPVSAGRVSFEWVMGAIGACRRDPADALAADAMVTAPISKEHWHAAGLRWPGHTELLAHEFESPRTAMLFVGPTIRVILASVHVPLREVVQVLTPEKVLECIELGAAACRELGVARPRIAVAGINPHAGEHGLFGDEESRLVDPAVERARETGLDVSGPLPGDAVFLAAAKGRFDLVVAMYHDQGLIPVKLLDRERAVNVSVGLRWRGRRIVRTSPAHGTAFDIAGKGIADASSMIEAIDLAIRMVADDRARTAAGCS